VQSCAACMRMVFAGGRKEPQLHVVTNDHAVSSFERQMSGMDPATMARQAQAANAQLGAQQQYVLNVSGCGWLATQGPLGVGTEPNGSCWQAWGRQPVIPPPHASPLTPPLPSTTTGQQAAQGRGQQAGGGRQALAGGGEVRARKIQPGGDGGRQRRGQGRAARLRAEPEHVPAEAGPVCGVRRGVQLGADR